MTNVFRTLICDAADQQLIQETGISIWGDPAIGMWVVGLSPDGNLPITNYISTGIVEENASAQLLPVLIDGVEHQGSASGLKALLQANGYNYTVGEVRSAVNAMSNSDEDPWVVMESLGLQPINTPI